MDNDTYEILKMLLQALNLVFLWALKYVRDFFVTTTKSLQSIDNRVSKIELRKEILDELKKHNQIKPIE